MTRLVIFFVLVCGVSAPAAADWRQFRGTDGNSVAADAKLPIRWSDRENIAWKVELPGRGPSSPIVVGDRVVVTCSDGARQQQLHVLCFSAANGRRLWHRQFWATGRTFVSPTSANAAPTPASDGRLVFAFYSSCDLVCLDLDGGFRWFRGLGYDYPKAGNDVGMASSPVVAGGTVVVQVEALGDAFTAGIDTTTGRTRWQLERDRVKNWASPVLVRGGATGRDIVLLQNRLCLAAYDVQTGRQCWRYDAPCSSISSPTVAGGRIFLPAAGLTVLNFLATETAPGLAWDSRKLGLSNVSPVVHGERLYTINGAGVLSCADTNSGAVLWRLRLKGPFWSTPVLAGGYLYCTNDRGLAQVVRLGEQGEVAATNDFGETIQATPAVAGRAMYFRSDRHLWKIAE